MNDDFLHRLRKEPSAKYLAKLKASLDRQAVRQVKNRRTLLRTAILGALIGGSAAAVAFVAWRGAARSDSTATSVRDGGGQRSTTVSDRVSAAKGGGGLREEGSPATGSTAASQGGVHAPAPSTASVNDAARPIFRAAGVGAFIANAEEFVRGPVRMGLMKQPQFTQTTASQAFAMLCHVRGSAGADSATADLIGASRRMTAAELATCKRNSVPRITELRPGYEAAVLVRSKLYDVPKLSARDIFLALAAKVPDLPNRPYEIIDNPYHAWNAINPSLAQEQIEIWGPSWSSPTAALFRETVMEAGCLAFPVLAYLKEKNPDIVDKLCHAVREDGIYHVYGQVDANLGSRLDTYPNALALIGVRQITSGFVAASIDGTDATPETIVAGSYPGSRPLFLYVNTGQAVTNRTLADFILGFERSVFGSASDMSLVSPDPAQRQVELRNAMTLPELIL